MFMHDRVFVKIVCGCTVSVISLTTLACILFGTMNIMNGKKKQQLDHQYGHKEHGYCHELESLTILIIIAPLHRNNLLHHRYKCRTETTAETYSIFDP